MIKAKSAVGANGQLVIPLEIRKALGIQRGDKISWVADDLGQIRLTLTKGDLMALKGRIKSGGRSITLGQMDEAVKAGASDK